MECDQHAGLFKDCAGLVQQIHSFEFPAGAVDENDRRRRTRFGDLLGHLPAFADVVQHHAEIEFLRQPQHRHDVVMPVRVVVDNPLAIENLEQPLHSQITIGHLLRVIFRAFDLLLILLRFDEFDSNQGRRLGPRFGERRFTLRVGPVGHFHAAGDVAVGVVDQQIIHNLAVAKFEV